MFPNRVLRLVLPIVAVIGFKFTGSARAVDFFAVGGTYIYKFDVDTGARTTLVNQTGANFWGAAADNNGNVFATNYSNSTVVGVTSAGGSISGYSQISNPGWSNIGIAFNPVNSTLAVAQYVGGGNANIYSLAGGTATSTTSFTLPGNTQGLGYDAIGNLYAAQNSGDNVSKNGTTLFSYASNPESLYVSGNSIYVAGSNKVRKYDLSGNVDTSFGSSGELIQSGAFGVVAYNGYLFVSGGTSINKYNASTGALITSGWGSSVGGEFKSLAMFDTTPVPEPSTYALTAIASGMMAAVARRRKARLG